MFRFDAAVYFANAELFHSRIHIVTGIDPLVIQAAFKWDISGQSAQETASRGGATEGEAEEEKGRPPG